MNEQIYREQLMDHYHNPRNYGQLDDATNSAMLENLSCGDKVEVFLKTKDSKLEDMKFEAEGCAICIATASILSDEVKNKTLDEIKVMKYENLTNLISIELSPSRIKCAHLPLLAIQKALTHSSS